MTRGEVLQLVGVAALLVGLFAVLGVGWGLVASGVIGIILGEILDVVGVETKALREGRHMATWARNLRRQKGSDL